MNEEGESAKSEEILTMWLESVLVLKKGGTPKSIAKTKKEKEELAVGLIIGILAAIICTTPAFALPTATNFGVDDTSGYKNTYAEVPVNITTVQNGPIISVIFDISFDKSVINVVDVQNGALTSSWDNPAYNNTFPWGTRVSIVYDGQTEHALQNESIGSIALLNFSVSGELGETSMMNLTNIQLAEGPPDYQVGTAPAKNGTFTLLVYGLITGHLTDNIGAEMEGVTVNLTPANSSIINTTSTNGTGYYSLTTVEIGDYYLNFSKPGFWDNATSITIESGDTKTVNIILWKKGDLNDNGLSADAGDLAKMKDATVGKITADWKYDLNTNGIFADAGDLAKMKDASVGKIELL